MNKQIGFIYSANLEVYIKVKIIFVPKTQGIKSVLNIINAFLI